MCHQKTRARILTEILFVIARIWKLLQCLSIVEWGKKKKNKKLWYVHIVEYHTVMRRNKIQSHAMTWINLRNTTLPERRQTQGISSILFYLYEIQKQATLMVTLSDGRGHRGAFLVLEMFCVFDLGAGYSSVISLQKVRIIFYTSISLKNCP